MSIEPIDINLERFDAASPFCGFALIKLRSELDLGIIRLKNGMDEMDEIPDEVRKSSEDLLKTLQSSILALCELEEDRNLSCKSEILERRAHQLTLLQLQEAEKENKKLTQEGFNLRKSLKKFMR